MEIDVPRSKSKQSQKDKDVFTVSQKNDIHDYFSM